VNYFMRIISQVGRAAAATASGFVSLHCRGMLEFYNIPNCFLVIVRRGE
jgi:hypothetical protein